MLLTKLEEDTERDNQETLKIKFYIIKKVNISFIQLFELNVFKCPLDGSKNKSLTERRIIRSKKLKNKYGLETTVWELKHRKVLFKIFPTSPYIFNS